MEYIYATIAGKQHVSECPASEFDQSCTSVLVY